MACCGWKALVITALAVAVLAAYAVYRKTTVTVKLKTTIKSDPQSVFKLFENPQDLVQYHPYFAAVEVIEKKVEKGSVSSYILRIREEVPPAFWGLFSLTNIIDGNYTLTGSSALQSDRFTISFENSFVMLGIVTESKMVWTVSPTADGKTLLSEVIQLHTAKMFGKLLGALARPVHRNMLSNVKEIAERRSK